MGRKGVGVARRPGVQRRNAGAARMGDRRHSGARNSDGTWVAGVERGPYKPPAFPIGSTIGNFTVIDWRRHVSPGGRNYGYNPICRCKCGWEGFVEKASLRSGRSTQCDTCARITAAGKRFWKYKSAMPDDAHRVRLLNRLSSAISRCHNPRNAAYRHYGERGVVVAEEWRRDRAAFLRYVQTLPGWDDPNLEMDRENVNGGYVPGNIRFVTRRQNVQNKRRIAGLELRVRELEAELARLRSGELRAA